jgi:hypothetical protein
MEKLLEPSPRDARKTAYVNAAGGEAATKPKVLVTLHDRHAGSERLVRPVNDLRDHLRGGSVGRRNSVTLVVYGTSITPSCTCG